MFNMINLLLHVIELKLMISMKALNKSTAILKIPDKTH